MSFIRMKKKLALKPGENIYALDVENELELTVIADKEINISAPILQDLPRKSGLKQEIEACLKILRAAQNTIPKSTQTKQRQYYLTTTFCMMNIVFAMSSPAIMLALMLLVMENLKQKALANFEKNITPKLNDLMSQLTNKETKRDQLFQKYQDEIDRLNQAEKEFSEADSRFDYLREKFTNTEDCIKWKDKDGHVQDVNILFPKIGYWYSSYYEYEKWSFHPCTLGENNQIHPIKNCNNIINEACEAEKDYRLKEIKWLDMPRGYGPLRDYKNAEYDVDNLKDDINHIKTTPLQIDSDPITITLFTILGVAAIGALIYQVMSWRNVRNEHQEKIKRSDDVVECLARLNDLESTNRVINLLPRLEINLKETINGIVYPLKINFLITFLEDKLIDLREKEVLRLSFLSGANYPDIPIANFFARDRDLECTKRILHFANMLPNDEAEKMRKLFP